jgi:transcription antitermination factor NusG
MIRWYAIRVSYGRVMKFSTHLQGIGIECFVPMCKKTVKKAEKTETQIVPAVSNLCFVHASRAAIDDIFLSMGDNKTAHYIWDKGTRQPIIVQDKPMQDFMQISRVMSDEILYLKDISDKLRQGQKVRVTDGPFKGVEGTVVRVKRSRRVMVELPGMLAIATTYVDPRNLELME